MQIKIKDFFDAIRGLNNVTANNFVSGSESYINYKSVFYSTYVNDTMLLTFNSFEQPQNIILKNDILITLSSEHNSYAGQSAFNLSNQPTYLNSFCFALRLKEEFKNKISPHYVFWLLQTPPLS